MHMEKELFISWSGPRSKAVAGALYDWLPKVIQFVKPWLSAHDIAKGTRWPLELTRGLEQAHFGLICLTPENLDARWILFEAGALVKAVKKADTFVWTYLFEVEPADIEWPLAQFQHTKAEKEDTRTLVHTIHQAVGSGLSERQVNELFDETWTSLERCLREIPLAEEEPKPQRSPEDLLEEILELIRDQARVYPTLLLLAQSSEAGEFMSKFEYLQRELLTIRDMQCPDSCGSGLSVSDFIRLYTTSGEDGEDLYRSYRDMERFQGALRRGAVTKSEVKAKLSKLNALMDKLFP
jgi:hypothetical protein